MVKFDGNVAWNEAMRQVSANREVLLVMAGVFLFLPVVVAQFFMGDIQPQIMALMPQMKAARDPMLALAPLLGLYAKILPYVLALILIDSVGKLGMMALLTDQRRPTVAEALGIGIKSLPTLIGVGLLLLLGYLVVALAVALVAGVVVLPFALLGLKGLGVALAFTLVIVVLLFFLTRLSLIVPVVIVDGVRNPVAAITGSWALVKGNTRRLLVFYALLFIAYFVLALVVTMVLGGLVAVLAGKGTALTLGLGIVQGAMGAAFGVVFTALLVAIHRQLAGASPQALAGTLP